MTYNPVFDQIDVVAASAEDSLKSHPAPSTFSSHAYLLRHAAVLAKCAVLLTTFRLRSPERLPLSPASFRSPESRASFAAATAMIHDFFTHMHDMYADQQVDTSALAEFYDVVDTEAHDFFFDYTIPDAAIVVAARALLEK